MFKLKVYIVHQCEIIGENKKLIKEARVLGVYLDKESAQTRVNRLKEEWPEVYFAMLKKTLRGDYWCSDKSGFMFIKSRQHKIKLNKSLEKEFKLGE